MSTFDGLVEEIPGVSLDRFDGKNLESSVFFLSHFHADHTRGIDEEFFRLLKNTERVLYCTTLTKLFLRAKYNLDEDLARTIKCLVPGSPVNVAYRRRDLCANIYVDSVPAGHCPGSTMFIFSYRNRTVLCTGDFRIFPDDLPKIKSLTIRDRYYAQPRSFDAVYLDTTFLNPQYSWFPTRRETLEEICRIALPWIEADAKNVVSLVCPANYGSEFLFLDLVAKLKIPIHVKPQVYRNYSRIPELRESVTERPENTRLHACASKIKSPLPLPCSPDVEDRNVLTVVVSAYRWKNLSPSRGISERDKRKKNHVYVCCSMHSSYDELKHFLEYFQPSRVHPCVDPPAESSRRAAEILDELRLNYSPVENERGATRDSDFPIGFGDEKKDVPFRSAYFSDDSDD